MSDLCLVGLDVTEVTCLYLHCYTPWAIKRSQLIFVYNFINKKASIR